MSEKKKSKQRMSEEEQKVTKEEYAVAKYLRFGLPVREGKLHGMEVKCFIANAAVDKLLESKWSVSKNKTDAIFVNRASCIFYMNVLLEKGLFHRADRDRKKKDKESTKKKKKDTEKEESLGEDELRQRKGKKEKKSKKEKDQTSTEKSKDDTDEKKKEEKKKKEKRLKLLMSENQWFEDGDEVYVWIYDPVNVKTFLIGLLMVLGAIGLCMFPLWPEEVRIGVYYLSLAAAGFVGFILFLAVVRLILFCIVWALTLGKHHFWFLPNLTEDVGFFDSFRPLYKHDVMSKEDESDSSQSGKKKKKKKSDNEQDDKESKKAVEKSSDKDDSDEFEVIKKEDLDESKEEQEKNTENSGEEDEEENDMNEDESEDFNEDEDVPNNSSSEVEDKKSK